MLNRPSYGILIIRWTFFVNFRIKKIVTQVLNIKFMKNIIFFFVLLFGALSIQAQDAERYSAEMIEQAKKAGEILVFEQKTIPLGAIEKGSFPEMTFRFLNIGDEAIEYSFFDVCSCSQLKYDKDAKIQPGEEGIFHIVFDSKEREDEEPVEINFELKNKDKRVNMGYFYTVYYTFNFK